ncbi:hypothetical protein FRC11_007455, partial [Ceratobasidium sp. 423]
MPEQFTTARDLLRSALDQYLNACLPFDKSCIEGCFYDGTGIALMDGISDELLHAPSYEATLNEAREVFASTKSRSARITPINRFPTDVLTEIFKLVTVDQNCIENDKSSEGKNISPKYPCLLARVCSRWRQVVIGAGDLWTHIDMPWFISADAATLARVEDRIARSGGWPLDIHIIEPQIGNYRARSGLGATTRLLVPVSSQIRSLDLKLGKTPGVRVKPRFPIREGYSLILDTCLSNCEAGILTRLAVNLPLEATPKNPGCYFFEASTNPRASPGITKTPMGILITLTLSEEGLENILFLVSTLELQGCYPRWASKAYHNLVELHLGSGASVSETELLKMLSSSPKLRLLDFGLTITHLSPGDHKITPVLFADLETLITGKRTLEELGSFLRLICPGLRPLSILLDMVVEYYLNPSYDRDSRLLPIAKFLASTNSLTICMTGSYHCLRIVSLLRIATRARALVLHKLDL